MLLAAITLHIGLWGSVRGPASTCGSVSLGTRVGAGDTFKQKVDDRLTFEIGASKDSGSCDGWYFTLEDAGGHDLYL